MQAIVDSRIDEDCGRFLLRKVRAAKGAGELCASEIIELK
jgi:hypothetical protein